MATKIRLQRNGRKSYAFYSIVIADVRAPRDGKFTEKIGTYNPNTNPATVDLNFERALHWVMCGAQPTDTVRNILSKEGVYMKKHLLGGVAKGAFTEAEAEAKFEAWKNNKQSGLATLKAKLDEAKKAEAKARLEAEKKVNEEIAKKVAEKKAAEEAAMAETGNDGFFKPNSEIDFSKAKVEPLFTDYVDFDTFSKSDFRAVKVKECVAVPKSKKLLQFTLDDGTGTDRTILSGIHSYYEPEELVGKTLIAITNLPPRKMMGIESCGMLLSAVNNLKDSEDEELHLLMVDNHIPAGAKLY